MPTPRLLHPVPVIIQQLDKANTLMDDDFREPIQHSARQANVTLQGQHRERRHGEMEIKTRDGLTISVDGYVLFRYVDLAAAGITLAENDRFVKIGNKTKDVYIVAFQDEGHYPSAGGATLVKAYYKDRQPIKQGLGI